MYVYIMKYNETKYGVCWQLIEATGTVLSMFDKKISEATAENFKRENIDVHANTFVKEVSTFFFFFLFITLGLELSDTKVYEP